MGLLAVAAIFMGARLLPDVGVVQKPLGKEQVGEMPAAQEARRSPEPVVAVTDRLANLRVAGVIEATLPDLSEPVFSGDHHPSREDGWDVDRKWTIDFEIDRSLVYQRGYPRKGPGGEAQYFGLILGPRRPPIELGRLDLPLEGPASITFRSHILESTLDGSTFVLASSPDGVAATSRVFFGKGLHARIFRPLLPGDQLVQDGGVSREGRLRLGRLPLVPVPRLGVVRVEPREDVGELELYVAPYGLTDELLGQFGRPTPGGLRVMTSNGGQVEAFSFANDTKWSALLKAKGGALLASVEADRGTDLVIEYSAPQGLVLSVDLSRTPDARRVIVVPASAASPMFLEDAAYEARVQSALRTAAIPLPRFRGPQSRYKTGLLEIEDGAVRVEVWTRKGGAAWQRKVTHSTTVAGNVVEVFL
ncbi:MAG: hypothetical protein ACJA2W_003794 [Planctomycetota bacterium]|jgi:hypothetical protein